MSTTTQTESAVPTGTWKADPVHSSASFEVEHAGLALFRGEIGPVAATLTSDEHGAALEGGVAVDGIGIDDENLRPHLLSPDFFDAERNPRVDFRSTAISGSSDELEVTGELSMAGASRSVTAVGRLRGPVAGPAGEKIALSLETVIDRTAFGMDWQMPMPGGQPALAHEVRLIVELELDRS